MAAAIVKRNDFAARAAIKHDRPFQNGARQLLAVDQLVIPRRDVPGIVEKDSVVVHVTLPVGLFPIVRSTAPAGEWDLSGHTVQLDGQSLRRALSFRLSSGYPSWIGATGSCFVRWSSMAASAPPPARLVIPN